jgi:hypothetical protein
MGQLTWFEHASELKCLWNDTFCPHNASTELEAWGYCCFDDGMTGYKF